MTARALSHDRVIDRFDSVLGQGGGKKEKTKERLPDRNPKSERVSCTDKQVKGKKEAA